MKKPFSKDPRVRSMKKRIDELQVQIHTLESEMSKSAEASEKTTPPNTPQQEAIRILEDICVTPTDDRVASLTPVTETLQKVREAPTKVKQTLFSKDTATPPKQRKSTRGNKEKISKLVQLPQNYVNQTRSSRQVASAVKTEEKALVKEFLRRPENSYELPGKKDNIRGKTRYGLTDTLKNLHSKFLSQYPRVQMSYPSFCRAKDPLIKQIQWTNRKSCLCSLHANMAIYATASKVLPTSGEELCRMTDDDVKTRLERSPATVNYKLWERKDIKSEGKLIKRWTLVDKSQSKADFITNVLAELAKFRPHCERISDIYSELRHLKQTMPDTEAVIQMDFAENYSCKYQNEIAACFFNNQQITVHPISVTYVEDAESHTASPRPIITYDNDNIQSTSYVGLSDDTSHTVASILAFMTAVISYINIELPKVKTLHFVTDSPNSQYRNRSICAIVNQFQKIFNMAATWTWLEQGHGKGPCDGIGGGIKKLADNLVKSGVVVRNVDELAKALNEAKCKSTILQCSSARIDVMQTKINRWTIPAAKGIMKKHLIVNVGDTLWAADKPCFKNCCYQDGMFQPTCPGWHKAFGEEEVHIPNVDDDMTTDMRSTRRGQRVDPQENIHRVEEAEEAPTADEVETVETEIKVGSYIATVFGKRWYLAKVLTIMDGEYELAYMHPCRGLWKWGRNDQGWVEEAEILASVTEPHLVGSLWDITPQEKAVIEAKLRK